MRDLRAHNIKRIPRSKALLFESGNLAFTASFHAAGGRHASARWLDRNSEQSLCRVPLLDPPVKKILKSLGAEPGDALKCTYWGVAGTLHHICSSRMTARSWTMGTDARVLLFACIVLLPSSSQSFFVSSNAFFHRSVGPKALDVASAPPLAFSCRQAHCNAVALAVAGATDEAVQLEDPFDRVRRAFPVESYKLLVENSAPKEVNAHDLILSSVQGAGQIERALQGLAREGGVHTVPCLTHEECKLLRDFIDDSTQHRWHGPGARANTHWTTRVDRWPPADRDIPTPPFIGESVCC